MVRGITAIVIFILMHLSKIGYEYTEKNGTTRESQTIVMRTTEEAGSHGENAFFYYNVFDNRPMFALYKWYQEIGEDWL